MFDWVLGRVVEFSRIQWYMEAPIFDFSHYELDENCVLSLPNDDGCSGQAKEGGFGTVRKNTIHPAHHRFHVDKLSMV